MYPRLFTNEQEKGICRLYFEEKLSAIKLAKQFQCSYGAIRRLIERNGFKLRSRSKAKKGKFGAKNNSWKGGKGISKKGYVLIYKPEHPFARCNGYVLEHRVIMEKQLGRFLKPSERVHHKNGIKGDNRKGNLKLFESDDKHQKWEHEKKKQTKLLQCDFS